MRYSRLALLATLLALIVVILGAYTRLSDAGLGCPDWPGCYGHLTVPHTTTDLQHVATLFPGQIIEAPKAWKEMVHRYFAGTLAIFIFILAVWAVKRKKYDTRQPLFLSLFLVLLVIFQAALGMWTVTWKVLPIIVSTHLLCGLTVTALLWYLHLTSKAEHKPYRIQATYLKPWAVLGLLILATQIFLGAWTSTTYSALACTDFPTCSGYLFPHLALHKAFHLFQPIGINYEGGILDKSIRMTIQMVHRYGAFITSLYLYTLSIWIIFSSKTLGLRGVAGWLVLWLTLQILLGIGNVLLSLPLWTAVMHNGVAALLLLTLLNLIYKLKKTTQ